MPIETKKHEELEDELLMKIMVSNGNGRIGYTRWEQNEFLGYPPTVWHALYKKGFLEDAAVIGGDEFFLEPAGFLKGIKLNETYADPAFVSSLQAILTAARDLLDDRSEPKYVDLHEIAIPAKVSEEFLANIIDCNVIEEKFDRVGISWANRYALLVEVPQNLNFEI